MIDEKIKCEHDKCPKRAIHIVKVYNTILFLCFEHLSRLHYPENDDNVECIGKIEWFNESELTYTNPGPQNDFVGQ